MFERFTEALKNVVRNAEAASRRMGHGQIACDHLLVGLYETSDVEVAATLEPFGLTHTVVERWAIEHHERVGLTEQQLPFTPPARKALELALREALSLGHNFIGSSHLALALIRLGDQEPHALAGRRDAEDIRAALVSAIDKEQLRNEGRTHAPASSSAPEAATASSDRDTRVAEAVEEAMDVGHQEAVQTYSDRPAERDTLGRRALAEVLADRIRRASGENTESPEDGDRGTDEALLVHLHAPWGAGKTSLLRFLEEELSAPADDRLKRWIVVNFSAWQHQRVAPPWWWLLAAVRRDGLAALRSRSRRRAWIFWLRDMAWRGWNARAAIVPALIAVAVIALLWATEFFGLDDQSLKGLKAAATAVAAIVALGTTVLALVRGVGRWLVFGSSPPGARLLQRVHDPLRAAQRRFHFLIARLGEPVAIFIDDLDRCRASYVVELLEGIQTLFLDEPVTFLVAADRQWLCESYGGEYERFADGVGDPGRPLGYLFVEKTFQISIEVPSLPDSVRQTYWRDLVRGDRIAPSPVIAQEAERAAAAFFANLRTESEISAALSAPVDSPDELDARRRAAVRRLGSRELERNLEHLLEPYSHLLERNPRALKRLVNAYGVERAFQIRSGVELSGTQRKQNVLWTIARLRWPVLAEYLAAHPSLVTQLAAKRPQIDDSVPEHLRPLFLSEDVRAVFQGRDVAVALDEQAIRRFLGADAPPKEPSSPVLRTAATRSRS